MPPSPFKPQAYGPVFAALVAPRAQRPTHLMLESAFAHARVVDEEMAQCCLAAVWLLHDELDESHRISQNVDTPTGSFWHGIMHRREGDFANANYWFARIGQHEALPLIGEQLVAGFSEPASVAEVSDLAELQQTLIHRIAPSTIHNPRALTHACQAAAQLAASEADRTLCDRAQQIEWQSLFDYCYRQAIGA